MSSRYDRIAPRNFITREDILAAQSRGDAQVVVRENSTVTDEAREVAMKLGIRLDLPGALASNSSSAKRVTTATTAVSATAKPPLEDADRKVADAIAAVLAELDLGERAATLAPILTRRVFAGLAKVAERQ